jgi:hypothetical protein
MNRGGLCKTNCEGFTKTNSGGFFCIAQNELSGGCARDFGDFDCVGDVRDLLAPFAVRHRQRPEFQKHLQIDLQVERVRRS